MLALFQKFIFKKIVLQIGDEGARLTLFDKMVEKKTVVVSSVTDENIKEFARLLALNPSVPVYILADVSEQTFNLVNFPSSNRVIIKKLLHKRIKRDYDKSDLHNYYNVDVKKEKQKNISSFIIANLSYVSPLKDWLDYTNNMSNPVDAVYSLPVELSGLVSEVHSKLISKGEAASEVRWKILIIQSDIGGIRIIVNENSKLVFSRLINFNIKDFEDSDIETLKNQILGTIEYLRRIGFKDKHGLNAILLLNDDFLKKFNASTIKAYKFFAFKKDLLSEIITIKNKTKKELSIDEYISAYFVQKGKYIGFLTKNLEKISFINNINIALTFSAIITFLMLGIIILFNMQVISMTKKSIKDLESRKNKLSRSLETIREEKFGFDIDEDKVIDVGKLHSIMQDKLVDPLEIISPLSTIKPDILVVKEYSWSNLGNKKISVKIDAVFLGEDLSYEDLFSKYDIFIRDIKTEFNNYEIQHSELPDTINFDSDLDDVPITLNIVGPNK